MSFSNLLKNAQATNAKAQTLMASPASVMTLSLENEPVETLIEAYSGDEYIRLDGYDWYEDFEDNNYSTVDKNKNITVQTVISHRGAPSNGMAHNKHTMAVFAKGGIVSKEDNGMFDPIAKSLW